MKVPTRNVDEYLETLYRLGAESASVKTGDIASELGLRPASVTEMLSHLAERGYADYVPYKGARLTSTGLRLAQAITRKHRVVELFLRRVLAIDEDLLHVEACRLEHAVSDVVERKMVDFLCNPDNFPDCPDIPDMDTVPLRPLSGLSLGSRGVIFEVSGSAARRKSMRSRGIREGRKFKVIGRRPAQGPLTVKIEGNEVEVDQRLAASVLVEVE